VFSATLRRLYSRESGAIIIVQEAGWTSRSVWTDTENPVPTLGLDPRTPSLASHYTDHAVWPLLQTYVCIYTYIRICICIYIYMYVCMYISCCFSTRFRVTTSYGASRLRLLDTPNSLGLLWMSYQPDDTQHSQGTDIHAPAGFKPAIPASGRPQTHALNRTATGFGL